MAASESPWPSPAREFRSVDRVDAQDWPAIAAWLGARGHRLDVDAGVRQFREGLANLNYLIRIDGAPAVFRRPPPGPRSVASSDMSREFRTLRSLVGHYPLAPAPIAVCADRSVIGSEFLVTEHRPGCGPEALDPGEGSLDGAAIGSQLTDGLVDAMVALHNVERGAFAHGSTPAANFLARTAQRWIARARAAFAPDPSPALAPVVSALNAAVPTTSRVVMLHGDLKLDNLRWDAQSVRPIAVLDWDLSTSGDPLFDLGVLLSYWTEPTDPLPLRALGPLPSRDWVFPSRAEVVDRYFAAANVAVADLHYYLTLARLRLAVSWQQLHGLYGDDPRYQGFDALARTLLEWTADTRRTPL